MNIRRFFIILLLSLISISLCPQAPIRLGIINPTIHNIKTFNYLIRNNIISIPNLKLVAICYSHSNYNYEKTKRYVSKNKVTNVSFIDVKNKIHYNELYNKNSCTEDFKLILEKTDGLIFTGGDDLPAYTYGEKSSVKNANHNPGRHYFELSMLYHLLGGYQRSNLEPLLDKRPDYAIMGICLGEQSMSTAAGGTMIQDIPSEIYKIETYDQVTKQAPQKIHRNPWYNMYAERDILYYSFHKIVMTPQMQNIFKHTPTVLSAHHQAIKKIGKGFEPWAWSTDKKIIEAIQHQKYPNVFGVQFHPEATLLYKNTKYKLTPNDTLQNIPDMINRKDLQFHKDLWAYFVKKLKNSKANHYHRPRFFKL